MTSPRIRLVIGALALGACGGSPASHQPPDSGVTGAAGGGGGGGSPAATGQAGTSSSGDAAVDLGGPAPVTGDAGSGGAAGVTGAAGSAAGTGAGAAGTGAAGTSAAGATGAAGAAAGTGAAGVGDPAGPTGAAWDAKYPRDKRRLLLHDEGTDTLHYLDLGDVMQHWSTPTTTWSRGLQLVGGGRFMGSRNDGYAEYELATGKVVKEVKTFPNTVSVYRNAAGETMVAQGATLSFLDAQTDVVKRKVQYQGYGYVRLVRPTPQGTFLVPSDSQLFEGDDQGKVLWHTTAPGWFHMFEAVRLPNGQVLVATGYGSSLDVLDPTSHAVVQRIGTKMMPEAATVKPNFFGDIQVLPNGNYLTANWEGHGGGNGGTGLQVLEFDPAGKLVWFYKQDPMLFSSIQGAMILDGLDPKRLHVLAPSGVWAPVGP